MRESSIMNSSRNSNNSSNKSISNQTKSSLLNTSQENNNLKLLVKNKYDKNNDIDHTQNTNHPNLHFDNDIKEDENNISNDIEMNFLESLEYSSSSYTSCDDNNTENLNLSINFSDSLDDSSKATKHQYNTRYQARLEKQKKASTYSYESNEQLNQSEYKTNFKNTSSYHDNISVNNTTKIDKNDKNTIDKKVSKFQRSKPIPINVPASIAKRKICFDSISNLDKSITEYVMIDTTKIENQSEPVKHISQKISDSFREYLNSSVTMLKHSYNYITNNKSI